MHVKLDVLLSSFFHMLNGMPQLLTVDIIDVIIGPSFKSHFVLSVFLSCIMAVVIKLSVSTSVIRSSKCSSSGIIWSVSISSNGGFLQLNFFVL